MPLTFLAGTPLTRRAKAIEQNTMLWTATIQMSGTNMSDETGVALAKAIEQNTTLRTLTIQMSGAGIHSVPTGRYCTITARSCLHVSGQESILRIGQSSTFEDLDWKFI